MYQEFQRVERELENLSAMFMAFQFIQAKRIMQDSLEALERKTGEVQEIEDKIAKNKERANEIDGEIAEHQNKDSVSIDFSIKFIFPVKMVCNRINIRHNIFS